MKSRSFSDGCLLPVQLPAGASTSPPPPASSAHSLIRDSGEEFRDLLRLTADRLSPYIDSLRDAHPFNPPLATSDQYDMLAAPPARPTAFESLLDSIMRSAMVGIESNSPLHLGYIASGNIVESAIGDLLAKVLNRYVSLRAHGEGIAAMEHSLIRWLVSLFGLPDDAHGLMTTGGSMAILSAMVGAREAYIGAGGDISKARIYVSDQTHGSVKKAAHFAGISQSSIVKLPTLHGRLSAADVEIAIERDVAHGYRPMCLCATAGTTSTGAIEPLSTLADVAKRYRTWLHVDACYGGFFILTDRGRHALNGIERADSISLDPHKSLFLPSGTGILLVRHAKQFANSLSPENRGPYLRDVLPLDPDSWPEFADMGLELTREARCLRMWLPLHRHGIDAFRITLDEKLDLANYLYDELAAIAGLQMLEHPDLSIVCCRLSSAARTELLLRELTAAKDFLYSSTVVDGGPVLRFCVLQWRTKKSHIDFVVQSVKKHLGDVTFVDPLTSAPISAASSMCADSESFDIAFRSSLASSQSSVLSIPQLRTPSSASLFTLDSDVGGEQPDSDGDGYSSLVMKVRRGRMAESLRVSLINTQ